MEHFCYDEFTFSTNNVHIITLQKQIVKEGQVLCYIEQLGGELPIEVCVLTFKFLFICASVK
jgi:hypothetical protein